MNQLALVKFVFVVFWGGLLVGEFLHQLANCTGSVHHQNDGCRCQKDGNYHQKHCDRQKRRVGNLQSVVDKCKHLLWKGQCLVSLAKLNDVRPAHCVGDVQNDFDCEHSKKVASKAQFEMVQT